MHADALLAGTRARAMVAAMDALLTVQALSRCFGRASALNGVDFQLRPGEVVGLLGPNGAGKTTCLRILAGLLAPSSGRVAVAGHDMVRAPQQAKRHIGYLPERPPLYPEMRVDEYLTHCARLRGVPAGARARAVARSLRQCGLQSAARRLLGRLSKGYRQRAGLAAALLHEPELVILDEPTDGLDPLQMREVRGLIADLAGRAAVLISSHALAEVQASCQRVLVLDRGRLLHDGPLAAPNAVRLRLARAPAHAALTALTPVAAVEADNSAPEPGLYRVSLAEGADAEQLAAAVVAAGWGLLELTPVRSDVERLFFRGVGLETAA